jgi:hypothetical protein
MASVRFRERSIDDHLGPLPIGGAGWLAHAIPGASKILTMQPVDRTLQGTNWSTREPFADINCWGTVSHTPP